MILTGNAEIKLFSDETKEQEVTLMGSLLESLETSVGLESTKSTKQNVPTYLDMISQSLCGIALSPIKTVYLINECDRFIDKDPTDILKELGIAKGMNMFKKSVKLIKSSEFNQHLNTISRYLSSVDYDRVGPESKKLVDIIASTFNNPNGAVQNILKKISSISSNKEMNDGVQVMLYVFGLALARMIVLNQIGEEQTADKLADAIFEYADKCKLRMLKIESIHSVYSTERTYGLYYSDYNRFFKVSSDENLKNIVGQLFTSTTRRMVGNCYGSAFGTEPFTSILNLISDNKQEYYETNKWKESVSNDISNISISLLVSLVTLADSMTVVSSVIGVICDPKERDKK